MNGVSSHLWPWTGLLQQCLEKESKLRRLAETVVALPSEAISARRDSGLTPLETALRSRCHFFAVYRQGEPAAAAAACVLVVDDEEGEVCSPPSQSASEPVSQRR